MGLFAPLLPAEIERRERERIARKAPHLALDGRDPRPTPDMFVWKDVAELVPVAPETPACPS